MKIRFEIPPFLLIILIANLGFSCQKTKPKVLIIGIDGCRPDAMMKAQTPNLDQLMNEGAYTMKAQTDPMTFSGPAWSAMLTGVFHEKHGVISNGYEDPDTLNYPHFFRRIKQSFPDKSCYSFVTWGPIHKILRSGDSDYAETFPNDSITAYAAADKIEHQNPDLVFIQLDQVDGAGHSFDYLPESENYLRAIERADHQIGQILEALQNRTSFPEEDWLIIITADHGGSDFGHGKDIPEHREIFYIVNGQSVKKAEITGAVEVVDVAVTAMDHMGLEIREEWNLDGKVVK